ncbi:hypothetical protein [Cytobacillus firmus]
MHRLVIFCIVLMLLISFSFVPSKN